MTSFDPSNNGKISKNFLEKEFSNGGIIFNRLMTNGHFWENKGEEGHPKPLKDDRLAELKQGIPL